VSPESFTILDGNPKKFKGKEFEALMELIRENREPFKADFENMIGKWNQHRA